MLRTSVVNEPFIHSNPCGNNPRVQQKILENEDVP